MCNTLVHGNLHTPSLHQPYTWHTPSIHPCMVGVASQAVATSPGVVLNVKGLLNSRRDAGEAGCIRTIFMATWRGCGCCGRWFLLGGGVAGYIVWNKQDRAARQEAEADYNRMLQEQRMEQERELERQLAEQERIKREASQINGVWAHQDIDPTFYERYTETLEFRGDQYKYRRESNSRAYGFDWCHYTREGNKIYVDGKAIMTIEPNGNIVFSDRTYVKVR